MRALKIIGKISLHILSVLLCILLFVSTLATMLVADVKVATNKNNLQKVLSATLSAPTWRLGPITAATGDGVDLTSGGSLSDQIVEYAYEAMGGDELPFTLEDVKAFVEESTVKDFIAEKSASIISDIYTGENTTDITAEDIQKLLTENKDLIKEHFDLELSEEDIQSMTQAIDEMPVMQQMREVGVAAMITGSGVAPDDEGADMDVTTGTANPVAQLLDTLRTFTSTPVLLGCIGVCAVLVGLLFLCAWKKPYGAMFYSGATFSLAGLIFLVPTLIAWLAADTWLSLFSGIPMVGPISRMILMLTGGVCGCVFALGAGLIAGGIVLKIFLRKKRAAKAAAAEAAEAPAEEVTAEEPFAEEVTLEEPSAEEAPVEEPTAEGPAAEETATEEPV